MTKSTKKKTISKHKPKRHVVVVPVHKPAPKSKGYMPGLLGHIGATVGGHFGGPLGAMVGKKGGDWLGKITGMGAYRVKSNSLLGGNVATFGRGGAVTYAHREYLCDVYGSSAFTLNSYSINPGMVKTFPWLSLCAGQFEQYKMLGCLFEFKSTSADSLSSTNTALGTVVMATNYDTYDPVFSNKQQMEAYEFSSSAAPSVSQLHAVECDPKKNVLGNMYLRSGAVPTGADQRFYDVGTFQIATVGMQAASVIGELWVTYHVRFEKPKLPTPLNATVPTAHQYISLQTPWSTVSGSTGLWRYNLGSTFTPYVVMSGYNATFSALPAGRFFVSCSFNSAGTISSAWSYVSGVNATLVASFQAFSQTSSSATTTTASNYVFVVDISDPNTNSLTVALPQATVNGLCDVWMCGISSGLSTLPIPETIEERLGRLELACGSPPPTPHHEEEEELEKSVHLSRDDVRRMLAVQTSFKG